MTSHLFYFNGISATTGQPSQPPLSHQQIAKIARQDTCDSQHLRELKERWENANTQLMGPVEGIDPKNLEEAGWGVIFAFEYKDSAGYTATELKAALAPLLKHRQQQATHKHEHYYKEYLGVDSYRPNESKQDFLNRHGVGTGPADPEVMPYYLLLVGDPESIPYTFQYQLDVQRAVGRICFETIEDYQQYAQNVVAAETDTFSLPKTISFFGPCCDNDNSTQISTDYLLKPLSYKLTAEQKTKDIAKQWTVKTFLGDRATKAQLSQLLGGSETPTLLFTASHGAAFDKQDPQQRQHQGALICQDWPGQGPVSPNAYFCADDIPAPVSLLGRIIFNVSCFGAGTPKTDDFGSASLAYNSFMAQLPQRLLRQGALAVIGHVDRAWSYSFVGEDETTHLEVFENTLQRLMTGYPVGAAVDYFNERYAELSSDLNDLKERKFADDFTLAKLWAVNRDARNYSVIGDPAVRLPVSHEHFQQTDNTLIQRVNTLEAALRSMQAQVDSLQQQVKSLCLSQGDT